MISDKALIAPASPKRRLKFLALSLSCLAPVLATPAYAEMQFNPFLETPSAPTSVPATVYPQRVAAPQASSTMSIPRPKRLPIVKRSAKPNDNQKAATAKPQPAAPELSLGKFELTDPTLSATPEPEAVVETKPSMPEVPDPSWIVNEKKPLADSDFSEPLIQGNTSTGRNTFLPKSGNEHSAHISEAQPHWLRSTTTQSTYQKARRWLTQATNEYSVGAWASAEASTWQALSQIAEAIDLDGIDERVSSENVGAIEDLQAARTAFFESRDFLVLSEHADSDAIKRIAMSHQTKLLHSDDQNCAIATHASDRYLDDARIRLGRLAATSVDAAASLDLLAAIYLGRNAIDHRPGPAALCLRRAALQGQPNNASLATRLGLQLADTGLNDEAYLVLSHAYDLDPTVETSSVLEKVAQNCQKPMPQFAATQQKNIDNEAIDRPKVIQLSPADFAAISKSVIQVGATQPVDVSTKSSLGIRRPSLTQAGETVADASSDVDQNQPSRFARFKSSLGRMWR